MLCVVEVEVSLPAQRISNWKLLTALVKSSNSLCYTESKLMFQRIPITYVRFEVFTAVTMKNCVFWDVTPCGSLRTDGIKFLRNFGSYKSNRA
jgi:hypothetical protein